MNRPVTSPAACAACRGVFVAAILCLLALVVACSKSGPTSPTPPPAVAPLALTCPAGIEIALESGDDVPVTYTAPVPTGGRAPVTVNCGPPPGAPFTAGTSMVTCTASDAARQEASCSFGVTVSRVPRLSITTMLAFGDSVTEGKLSLTLALLIDSPPHSYPAALNRMLEERYSRQRFRVMNAGYGGERTTEGGARLDAVLRAHRPEAVLLMHGTNDLIGDGLPGVQRAADGLEELVKASVASGARTYLATLPPLGPGPKASCTECVEPFNERVRRMAPAKGAVLVDVHQTWGSRTGLMGADGIHPTSEGYTAIADAFFEALRNTLETQ